MTEAPLRSPTGRDLRRLFAIADALPQIVWSSLPDGHHDYFNRHFHEFTGASLEASQGDGWRSLFHPDDMAEAGARWAHSLATGDPYEVEYRMRDAHGHYRWMIGRALPLRDGEDRIVRWIGTCTDVDDLHQLRARGEVVNQELNHRIKNIFAVIGGLVRLEARDHPEAADFAQIIAERIDALGRAHSISIGGRGAPEQRTVCDIIETVLKPYEKLAAIEIDCPADLEVTPRAMLPFSLALHEIATNAAKHGALAHQRALSVDARVAASGDVTLVWREESPDAAAALKRTAESQGFGSQLLKMTLNDQLGGTISRTVKGPMLIKTLQLPAANFRDGAEA